MSTLLVVMAVLDLITYEAYVWKMGDEREVQCIMMVGITSGSGRCCSAVLASREVYHGLTRALRTIAGHLDDLDDHRIDSILASLEPLTHSD